MPKKMNSFDDTEAIPLKNGLFFTELGLKRFGKMVVDARGRCGYVRQDALAAEIYKETGYKISEGTISNIERGRLAGGQHDVISAIAHLGILFSQSKNRPYTREELQDICSERINPFKENS